MANIIEFARTAGFADVADMYNTLGRDDAKAAFEQWLADASNDASDASDDAPEPPKRTWRDDRLELGSWTDSRGRDIVKHASGTARLAAGSTEDAGIVYGVDADDSDTVRLIAYTTKRDGSVKARHVTASLASLADIASGAADLFGADVPATSDDADDAPAKPRVRKPDGLPPVGAIKRDAWVKRAKSHGLPTSGTKAQLRERIAAHIADA